MKNTQKGFIGVGAIIAIVAIVVVGALSYKAGKERSYVEKQPTVQTEAETKSTVSKNVPTVSKPMICDEVIVPLEASLGIDFIETNAVAVANYGAPICAYRATFNGVQDPGGAHFAYNADAYLRNQGWVRNNKFDADGVRGGSFLLEKNGIGVSISHLWVNIDEMCPAPAGGAVMCNPNPSQQVFELVVDIQRK